MVDKPYRTIGSQEIHSKPAAFKLLAKLLLMTLSVFLLGVLIYWIYPGWRWEQIPFHSLIEGVGGATAIIIAFMLLRFGTLSKELPSYVWVASALISMGTLDAFHAVVYPGQQFVWFHSVSNFAGGILFACVWLPDKFVSQFLKKQLPIVALITAFMVGFITLILPELVPGMGQKDQFSVVANILNLSGGAGFIIASVYFIVASKQNESLHFPVLANHCLLFGLSGLLFNFSALWDGVWWEWHVLRFAAYSFILYFFILTYKK